jgi:hypothetical protein
LTLLVFCLIMVLLSLGLNQGLFSLAYFTLYNLSPSHLLVYSYPGNLQSQIGSHSNFLKIEHREENYNKFLKLLLLLRLVTTTVQLVQQWEGHIFSSHLCLSLINFTVSWQKTRLWTLSISIILSAGRNPTSLTSHTPERIQDPELLRGECYCRHPGSYEQEQEMSNYETPL